MSFVTCCVPGCPGNMKDDIPLHRFPNPSSDIKRFRTWVLKIGGDLVGLEDSFIYNNRRVCRWHFEPKFLYPKNRLCQLAVPLLHLPVFGFRNPVQIPAEESRLASSHTQVPVIAGGQSESGKLPQEAKETSDILWLFDELFDSVNGSFNQIQNGNIYRAAVTPKSLHLRLRCRAKRILKTMKYKNNIKNVTGSVPSIKSWIKTLEGFETLTKYFFKRNINLCC